MKAMVLFSGGIDSTTCLGMAVEKYGPENVIALSISYGQKHTKEIEASDKIVKYYNVEHIYLDLAKIFQYSDCSLLSHSDKEIPKESYDEQIKSTNGSPVSTYVPFRNGLFLSSAASIAIIKMVESKSLKLYLFSFRNHGDFHEDCMNIIMKDLIKLMDPKYIEVWGKFTPRGGISIDPYCNYGKPGTKWEEIAFNRMANHDMYPEKVDNR